MKYRVFFVNRAFKELVDKSLLENLLESKNDGFYKKQLDYFLVDVSPNKILKDAIEYFKYRDDIVYKDDGIILSNKVTKEIATLTLKEQEVILEANIEDNPLMTFLYCYYRPIITIECDRIELLGE